MKSEISNKISLVQNSFPSAWTKDDVIRLLSELNEELESKVEPEKESVKGITKDDIRTLASNIASSIEDMGLDVIDDYELYLSGREVELESIEINTRSLKGNIESEIEEFIDNLTIEQEADEDQDENN
jgi:hypothetical protein